MRKVSTWLLLTVLTVSSGVAYADEKTAARHGKLREFEGLPVLELWGTHTEMAYAHGYLMAPQILPLIDDYMLSETVLPDPAVYHAVILPSIRVRWNWEPFEAEMNALYAGMKARLGEEGMYSKRLDRAVTVDDLMACNAIPDWHGLFCSSITLWGERTARGRTITARNLDYDNNAVMAGSQIIVVQYGDGSTQPFVSVTWPGLLGVFTGTNAEGVSLMSHDANSLPKSAVDGFTPRGLIFRTALEGAKATTAFEDVKATLERHRVICGNNQHVSVPSTAARTPAKIFEYDSSMANGSSVTVREPEPDSRGVMRPAIMCTNHVRARQSPQKCGRYEKLERALESATLRGDKLNWRSALALVREAAVSETLHTVVVEPDEGLIHVLIPARKAEPVTIPYAEWLKKRVE
jgi:hypothetical protein